MRVYGYRKVWRQLLDQGWDPLEAGRDQVARIMRELGLRGVRGGRRPVTTIPARGTGGRLDLAGRKFAARAPNRLHVADITVLLQCLFDRFGSVFPQCGLMVFPGVVIVSR